MRERHGWLYVDVYGGHVDSVALTRNLESGVISKIVPVQPSDEIAQLSFKLRSQLLEKQLYLENPNEILISLKTKKSIDLGLKCCQFSYAVMIFYATNCKLTLFCMHRDEGDENSAMSDDN